MKKKKNLSTKIKLNITNQFIPRPTNSASRFGTSGVGSTGSGTASRASETGGEAQENGVLVEVDILTGETPPLPPPFNVLILEKES